MPVSDNPLAVFSPLQNNAELSQWDRNGFVLFGSAILHIIVIMGIGFSHTPDSTRPNPSPSISTTLVKAVDGEEPDDTELFAEVSQAGGGESLDDAPVRSPLPAFNSPTTRLASRKPEAQLSQEQELIVVEIPDSIFAIQEPETITRAEDLPEAEFESEDQVAMLNSPLSAEFDTSLSLGGSVVRQKFISSRTREHKYASYMEAWRAQVEQVGNINYPEEARSRRLSGHLVLNVAINADGSIRELKVVRSSGQKVLDDAAVRIVMMAAPFDPFTDEIRAEADVIHITRTWQFLHNSTLIRN